MPAADRQSWRRLNVMPASNLRAGRERLRRCCVFWPDLVPRQRVQQTPAERCGRSSGCRPRYVVEITRRPREESQPEGVSDGATQQLRRFTGHLPSLEDGARPLSCLCEQQAEVDCRRGS